MANNIGMSCSRGSGSVDSKIAKENFVKILENEIDCSFYNDNQRETFGAKEESIKNSLKMTHMKRKSLTPLAKRPETNQREMFET